MVASFSTPTIPKKLETVEEYKEFLDKFDTFLLDCDGVLWHGNTLIEGIKETLEYLRSQGKNIVFVTNNSTKSRANYVNKFTSLGIQASETNIFSSAFATAVYLRNILNFPADKKVYVIGESGITDELKAVGIESTGSSEDNCKHLTHADLSSFEHDHDIGAVVCGFDINVNYYKYAKAFKYLTKEGVHFILTNDDSTFPTPNGFLPGTGSLTQPLIHSLGRQPLVMGKPNKPMLDCFFSNYHTDPSRTCMVGDRLDTDIEFGRRGGISTLMVQTGVSSEAEAMDPNQPIKPSYIIKSFGEFIKTRQ
ncbi:hypothetical protein BGW41_006418 [Actinomortierella wolfii]|nr:hypothetical protein BGW41_006418 [Actinomortierella wolfii]